MFWLRIIIFSILCVVKLSAAEVMYDSSYIQSRTVSTDIIEKYTNDKSFSYETEPMIVKPDNSFWYYIRQKVAEFFENMGLSSIWDWLLYILAASAIIAIIVSFMKTGFFGVMAGKNAHILSYTEEKENIHEIDFPSLIAHALENNEYRYAVRLQYLQLLKNLTLKGIIIWKPEKTNREYLRELYNKPVYNSFLRINRIFEYVWYGETLIDKEGYSSVVNQIEQCNRIAEKGL